MYSLQCAHYKYGFLTLVELGMFDMFGVSHVDMFVDMFGVSV